MVWRSYFAMFTSCRPVAVNVTCPTPATLATSVFGPTAGPSCHEPALARPSASVSADDRPTAPLPPLRVKLTVTPATGVVPDALTTRTVGGETSAPGSPHSVVALQAMTSPARSVAGVCATGLVAWRGSVTSCCPLHAMATRPTTADIDAATAFMIRMRGPDNLADAVKLPPLVAGGQQRLPTNATSTNALRAT